MCQILVGCHSGAQADAGIHIDHSFCEHASIFPVINYHMFSTIVSHASLDKLKQDMQASLRALDTRCNQIDVLSTKVNCLGGTGNNGT